MTSRSRKSMAALAVIMSILLVLLFVLDFAFGVRSDAMRQARAEITQSAKLQESIGAITDVQLRKLWGYGVTPGHGDEEARLTLIVTGERGQKELTVHVGNQGGAWKIVESSEPL
jgi:GTP cyclohydrolase III